MHDGGQALIDHGARIAGAENAFEEQNWLGNPRFTQGDSIFTFEHGKAIGSFAQGLDCPPLAVAVGIGLDHRPRFGVRRQPLGQPVIAQECATRYACADRS